MLEHGAYRMLLDEYYSTEKPLPANAMQLHRICMAFADDEQAALQSVLQQFFTLTENGYTHGRVEREIDKARQVSEKRKIAALSKWGKVCKINANADANADANVMQNGCYPQPQPNKPPIPPKIDSFFLSFWSAYPKKVGKGDAEKAWKKIKSPSATLDFILAALEWQIPSADWKKDNGQYVPNPSTYLNQRRWEDAPKEKPAPQDGWRECY